jgi:hypothetical protein
MDKREDAEKLLIQLSTDIKAIKEGIDNLNKYVMFKLHQEGSTLGFKVFKKKDF